MGENLKGSESGQGPRVGLLLYNIDGLAQVRGTQNLLTLVCNELLQRATDCAY